jgi:CheY-like chemotaxis protein
MEEHAHPSQATRVLVVDDERHTRFVLREFLQHAGFEVHTAGDGLEAMRVVRERAPDIVVTDIVMPNEDGLGLIGRLRQDFPGIPFVVMSGATFATEFHLDAARKLGASAVLEKPFKCEELLKAIRAIEAERKAEAWG